MSATDELRRMLDARGVEHEDKWSGDITYTKWKGVGGMWFIAHDSFGTEGKLLYIQGINMTPEQAIAATLGSGECEMEYGGDVTEDTKRVLGVYFCSECGSPNYNDCMPYFCIYCGKAVKR